MSRRANPEKIYDKDGNLVKRRSRLEQQFERVLQEYDAKYEYECTKIPYIVPESKHTYTVDWTLLNGVLVETKGRLADYAERRKYELLKQQNPDLDLRFVFADPNKLVGGTKTVTHCAWAEKHNFKWCSIKDTEQIKKWVKEK